MADHRWYRNTEWSQETQDAFFARLKRTRSSYNKAQYLRIQANYLQRDADPQLHLEALALLEQLFQECPEPSELASAYLQQAECLEALGRIEEAASAFMASVAANRRRTGVITTAPLEFGMFVVRNGLTGYYEEALSALEDTKMLTLFPSGQFMLHAAKAAIAAERGEMDNARQHARMALAAAAITDTGLRYHPKVGLVGKIEPRLHSRLVELAGA